jgi:hypothetical protein
MPAESMIERIAKAMWERTHDGVWPDTAEADATECVTADGKPAKLTTADIYREDARAAIPAMMPTQAECEALAEHFENGETRGHWTQVRSLFKAHIDSALKEGE